MSFNVNYYNYNSSLFSGLSSDSSSGMSSMLSDYMSIRNGSYGKLLKAYYAKQNADAAKSTSGASKKSASKKTAETAGDSKETAEYKTAQSDASALKTAAKALTSNSKLFEQTVKTTTNEDGTETTAADYDRDAIAGAVKSFVSAYNSAVKSAYAQDSAIVQKKAASMVGETSSNKNMLARVGITIGEKNELTVDEKKLSTANISTLRTLFYGSGSYASNVERKASDIASMTEQLAKTAAASNASTYDRNGDYSSLATGGIYDGLF